MRTLLFATLGFLAGVGVIAAVVYAVPERAGAGAQESQAVSGMPMIGSMSSGMTAAAASPALARLTIQHVERGCHVWLDGTRTGATMRLALKPGQRLSILNQDIDAHQVLQLAGPEMRMGSPMMMNHRLTLSFPRKGVYRLGTKTVEMPGGMMEVETIGPDNQLRLVVTVA